jgi:hypothetical protein
MVEQIAVLLGLLEDGPTIQHRITRRHGRNGS